MSRSLPFAALASIAALALAGPATANGGKYKDGEKELAEILDGRVKGEPTNCIRQSLGQQQRVQVIEGVGIVYGSGRTVYLNVPNRPNDLDRFDTLVVRRYGSQLCRQDMVSTIDPNTGMYTGNVFLGDFIPYTRAPKDEALGG